MLVWRVRTSEMDTPGVLVAGSGIKEVIVKGKLCILSFLFKLTHI